MYWGDNFGENLMNDKMYDNIAMQMPFLILDRECYVIEVSDRRPIIINVISIIIADAAPKRPTFHSHPHHHHNI